MVFQTQYNKTPLTLNEQNKSVLSVPIGEFLLKIRTLVFDYRVKLYSIFHFPVNTAQKSAGTIANGLLSSTSGSIKVRNTCNICPPDRVLRLDPVTVLIEYCLRLI